jgi:hypothetical protein
VDGDEVARRRGAPVMMPWIRRAVWAMRPVTPFLAAGLAVLVALVAIASPRFHTDMNDPDDAKGPLDVRRIRLDHEGRTEITAITFSDWTAKSMWDRGNAYVLLDTVGREPADYFIVVRSTGTTLQASLWRDRRAKRDAFLRNVKVRRKTLNSLTVRVPVKSLEFGRQRDVYYWWVVTSFTGSICRRTCLDRAPNSGTVEQWRPGHSPTPTTTTSTSTGTRTAGP